MQNMIFTGQLDNYLSSAIFCKSTGFRPKNRWTDFSAACVRAFLMLFIVQYEKSAFTNSKSGGSN